MFANRVYYIWIAFYGQKEEDNAVQIPGDSIL